MPTLTFKASADEAAVIRRKARARRMTLSAYARYAMLNAPADTPKPKQTGRIRPGRAVVVTPPLSREALASVIYDY